MQNFRSIESLRAYMAWWVVFGHAVQLAGASTFLPAPVSRILLRNDMAVNVFIIVSGFVITHLLLSKREEYLPYITRRAFRIFPIYLFSLALAISVTGLYASAYGLPWISGGEMKLDRIASQNDNFVVHLALHLSMLHGLVPTQVLPYAVSAFLTPAWSLSLEWQFYLVAPFLVPLLLRSTRTMIIACGVSLVLFKVATSGLIGEWQYPAFLLLAMPYFLIGILSRAALEYRPLANAGAELLVVLAFITLKFASVIEAIIWIAFLACAMSEAGRVSFRVPIVNLLTDLFVKNRFIATIGTWSYSTYLIHIPIFSIVVGAYLQLGGAQSKFAVAALLMGCIPVILLVSWVLFTVIESRFNRIGRQIAAGMTVAPMGSRP
ncbi:acyltransferase [Starkeya sp. ORNL1]|nr:acyltransferase [Starkeya sp. ORNL1]QJP12900.1 acyltransferase [Starkeya sp. ORNL1]